MQVRSGLSSLDFLGYNMLYILGDPARLGDDFWQRALPALSEQRREKVLRFRFARDRVLSAAAFLLLRLGLAQCYGSTAMPIFHLETLGKPVLCGGGPHFSLSHCHRAVLCALHTEAVGADVECWDSFHPERTNKALLARIFSPQEQAAIAAAPDSGQLACSLWTAKESQGKYTGQGLTDAPLTTRHADLHIDSYSFAAYSVNAALCRRTAPGLAPLPCREIRPEELLQFATHCHSV